MSSTEKQNAAKKSLDYIESGMILGLGSGSTSAWAIKFLGEAIQSGRFKDIKAVASSQYSQNLALEVGIPLVEVNAISDIDVYIDGADEFDAYLNMIKGGGGALVREKILASLSLLFVVIVDSSKEVSVLGDFGVPVEVLPFSYKPVMEKMEHFGLSPALRKQKDGAFYVTDNENYLLDLQVKKIQNPQLLGELLANMPGVVDHGLFIDYADVVLMGKEDEVITLKK